VEDISRTMPRKLKALRAHRSQLNDSIMNGRVRFERLPGRLVAMPLRGGISVNHSGNQNEQAAAHWDVPGEFPVISETFIVRQITGLIDLGHSVDIYADTRGDTAGMHAEVEKYRLLERTTFMDMPTECAPWELTAWPLAGETWVPGAEEPIPNWKRLADALPALRRCLERAPALTEQALSEEEGGHRSRSLSALYRRIGLTRGGGDVLHAPGPVAESYRFARELARRWWWLSWFRLPRRCRASTVETCIAGCSPQPTR
jgi:hypothetical protein